MGSKVKSVDPVLAVGIVISVSIAVALLLMGQARINSLMVGLLTTAITLLISVISRLQDTEKKVMSELALGGMLLDDQKLHAIIYQIVKSYRAAQRSEFDLFMERSTDALLECKEILSGLENGHAMVEAGGKFSYGRRGVMSARKGVKAVDYEDTPAWRSAHLKDVIQANSWAIERGIEIQRIFILSDEALAHSHDVLQAHLAIGTQVFVVSPHDLPSAHMLESYQIVDDHVLVVFYYTRDGKSFRGEKVSIDPIEVNRAIGRFNSTMRRARPYQPPETPEESITQPQAGGLEG